VSFGLVQPVFCGTACFVIAHWSLIVNQSLLLHVVERLEGLIGKLPGTIQNPILSELTPLKQLFLQQRPARLAFAGPSKTSPAELLGAVAYAPGTHVWQNANFPGGATLSVLDGRNADPRQFEEELMRLGADILFFVDDSDSSRAPRQSDLEMLRQALQTCEEGGAPAKVIIVAPMGRQERIRTALEADDQIKPRLAGVILPGAEEFMAVLVRELPNQARIEIIRISKDKAAQREIAQVLVKSTAAICTAIGAQPIPLADMPILTTLQLVMVSGIMYVSGRERTLRAATEFVGALGANLGAGMLFREGARAILKFVPGWGNLVSGMVAGAGTYAIGRSAEAFFIEGVSIKDARRTYRRSRKEATIPELPRSSVRRQGRRRPRSARQKSPRE
jgi:uncharacterized protein (DUF697 family)